MMILLKSSLQKIRQRLTKMKYIYYTKHGVIESTEPMSDIEAEECADHFANYESWSS